MNLMRPILLSLISISISCIGMSDEVLTPIRYLIPKKDEKVIKSIEQAIATAKTVPEKTAHQLLLLEQKIVAGTNKEEDLLVLENAANEGEYSANFAKAQLLKAHINRVSGDQKGAVKLYKDYLDQSYFATFAAALCLGESSLWARGTHISHDDAERYSKSAMRQKANSVIALFGRLNLGRVYLHKKEFDKAREQLEVVSKSNHPRAKLSAQVSIEDMRYSGKGYPKDTEISVKFFRDNLESIEDTWAQELARARVVEYDLTPKNGQVPVLVQENLLKLKSLLLNHTNRDAVVIGKQLLARLSLSSLHSAQHFKESPFSKEFALENTNSDAGYFQYSVDQLKAIFAYSHAALVHRPCIEYIGEEYYEQFKGNPNQRNLLERYIESEIASLNDGAVKTQMYLDFGKMLFDGVDVTEDYKKASAYLEKVTQNTHASAEMQSKAWYYLGKCDLAMNGKPPRIFAWVGSTLDKKSNPYKAFKKALELDPTSKDAKQALADL